MKKKTTKMHFRQIIFGLFFLILGAFVGIVGTVVEATPVYADGETTSSSDASCYENLGAIGWLVCPTTGKIAEAVDWLYERIEEFLVIDPVKMENGTPIYEVWKACRDITNVVFVIFLLVVIYSQITGVGISNYGVKKTLPKLIVVAILVNLSFLICSLMVDVSNIVGESLRGIFSSVAETATGGEGYNALTVSVGDLFVAIAGGGALTVGATVIAVETGVIWMLIPVVLGAIVAVVIGLITIALRQAVVALLIMISPLAVVAYMLPNTEGLFQKWKKLFIQMLVFYPMFSLLFGAANLAGFAIIASASNAFGILLGIAVQIFPLFFSWKLMKLSGTFLGDINTKLHALAAKPLAKNQQWADSRRELSRQKTLARPKVYTPSARLSRFLEDRKNSREIDTAEYGKRVKMRGLSYNANSYYKKDNEPNRKAERMYEMQAENLQSQTAVDRHAHNMDAGLGVMAVAGSKRRARLEVLDVRNMNAADALAAETSRGAQIEYENTKGRYERFLEAQYAHLDDVKRNDPRHRMHDITDRRSALNRYEMLKQTMGSDTLAKYAMADASQGYAAQAAVAQKKMQTWTGLTPAAQDAYDGVMEIARRPDSSQHIDALIGGLRVVNQYGDTDVVKKVLDQMLVGGNGEHKVELGTYASQAIAKFAMFDMKDTDPVVRRFGKYINVETAHVFNDADPDARRKNRKITYDEFINGEYDEIDDNGNIIGKARSRKGIDELLKGTSFKGMERTALDNLTESIRNASMIVDGNGRKTNQLDMDKFKETQEKVWQAIMPNMIGDQFSFLSGSEQINAMAKYITGMKGGEVDWKGIFGSDLAATLTDEQKAEYLEFLNGRTKSFMGGHVANQIARTKSDVLGPVLDIFRKKAEAENPGQTEEYYDNMADEKLAEAINPEVLDSVAIMYHKGYQGDTKANLSQHLKLNERYAGAQARRNRRSNVNHDHDDGMPVQTPDVSDGLVNVSQAQRLANLQTIFNRYNQPGSSNDIAGFWNEIRSSNVLPEIGAEGPIQDIDTVVGAGGYANVADLMLEVENLINNQ